MHVEPLEERALLAVLLDGVSPWLAQGPSPAINGQTENIPSTGPGADPVSGAIHQVVAHPTDADVLYAGAVNGGVWRTTNATALNPSWEPLTDQFAGLSMGTLQLDPTDATNNTLYAGVGRFSAFGGAGGPLTGLLRTTDGGDTWEQVGATDLAGRSISGVGPRGNTILAGANAAGAGAGMYRSTDGGATFTFISGLNGLAAGPVFYLTGDPLVGDRFYASVGGVGIFRTDDAGATWVNVSQNNATLQARIQAPGNNNTEMSVSPAGGRVYVGVLQNGRPNYIGFSDNQGTTWTEMDLPVSLESAVAITNATNATPIVITSAGHGLINGNQVRITGVLGNTAANGDFFITRIDANNFSLNGSSGNGNYAGGGTWRGLTSLSPREKPGGQGAIHFSILADPTAANIVYVGGDRQDTPFPNAIGATDFTGRLFRGDTTVAPVAPGSTSNEFSPQWEHLTHTQNLGFAGGGTAGNSAPHADSRDMVFNALGDLIEVDDGGIYRRTSPQDNTGDWFSLLSNASGGLQVTEMHDVVYDSVSGVVISGNQDTGTTEQIVSGGLVWRSVTTADGGDVVVDVLGAAPNSIRYSSTQNLGGFRYRVMDAANNQVGATVFPALNTGADPAVAPQFVTPLAVNNVVGDRLVIGGANGAYESTDRGENLTQVGTTIVNRNAIDYGGRRDGADNPDVLYVGSGSQVLARTATTFGALAATAALPPGVGTIVDVLMHPEDWTTVFALDNDQVFQSTDAGGTWDDITGNLVDFNLRSLEFVFDAFAGVGALLAGGDGGVYRSLTTALGTWTELGAGLPNAPVWDMDYDPIDDVLVAGTLGRGAWMVENASFAVMEQGILTICGDEDYVNQDDVFRLVRNAANPLILDVFVNSALPVFSVPLALLEQINVFGVGGNDTLIVDSTNGLINVPGGIRYDGDGACPDHQELGHGGFGYDRGFDVLVLHQDGGAIHPTSSYAVGPGIGSGISVIQGAGGAGDVQTIFFEELEPFIDLVPAATHTVVATPENNAINYAEGPNSGLVNLLNPAGATTGLVTVDNFEGYEFANKTELIINALAGDDTINLNNPTPPTGLTTTTVNGGDPTGGSDTVIVNGSLGVEDAIRVELVDHDSATVDITVDPSGANVALPTVTVNEAEKLIINGQGGDDALTIAGANNEPADYLHTPGAATDAGRVDSERDQQTGSPFIPLEYSGLGDGTLMLVVNGDGDVTALGTDLNDRFVVTELVGDQAQITHAVEPFLGFVRVPIIVDNIGTFTAVIVDALAGDDDITWNLGPDGEPSLFVTARGGSGNDVFTIVGAAGVDDDITLSPGLPDDPGGYAIARGLFSIASGDGYTGVEVVRVVGNFGDDDTLTVNGTAEDDTLTYTPTGAESGTFVLDGLNTVFQFVNLGASAFTVNLLGGAGDHVVVLGTNSHDVITVDAPNRRIDVENVGGVVLAPVTLAPTVETVTVRGRLGNDTIVVVPAPQAVPPAPGFLPHNLLIHVDGGPPSASDALVVAGNVVRASAGAPVTDVVPLGATDFVVVNRSRRPDEGVIRVFRDATGVVGDEAPNVATPPIQLPDILYSDVEIVSPLVGIDPVTGDPNLLILGPDVYEPNEFRTTAAFIGSGTALNVTNLAIFPNAQEYPFVPADNDWFRFVAQTTGILDFQIYFQAYNPELLPAGGNLDIAVHDASGDLIAGTGAFGNNEQPIDADERVRIPVVAGQTYYLRVVGESTNLQLNAAVNGYDMTVVNTPPPVPYDLELDDTPPGDDTIDDLPNNSDTGRSQFDNVTRNNAPEIFFRLDDAIFLNDLPGNPAPGSPPDQVIPIPFNLDQTRDTTTPGYRVAVFDEGVGDVQQPGTFPQEPIGYARMFAPGVYVFNFAIDAIDPAAPNGPTTSFLLDDGSHFLSARVQMVDPSIPTQTGFGGRSDSLEIVVDTIDPPVFFGEDPAVDPLAVDDGLHPDSDTGIEDQPGLFVDRITSDTTPTFWGIAEANAIVRVYVDLDGDGVLDPGADLLVGQTVASPEDGTNQFPRGRWIVTSDVDMNDPDYFAAIDGLRTIFVTAEDLAGNVTDPAAADVLEIFLDTRGPQVLNVTTPDDPDYALFDPKASQLEPSPLVFRLDIDFIDRPARLAQFFYPAVNQILATQPGNIRLVGDHNGVIPIDWIEFLDETVPGDLGRTTIRLHFADPLPDDRFTLTVSDRIKDDAGNALDGETNTIEPLDLPLFPSGDGDPGEDFIARFTIDSRPEIGTWAAGSVYVDINGNFLFDPQNLDYTNRDIVYTMGFTADDVFAGKFLPLGVEVDPGVRLFDHLAAYGRVDGVYRWLIDTNSNGTVDPAEGDIVSLQGASDKFNGLPVAGNFDGNPLNGDEVGLYTGSKWWFDLDHDFVVETPLASSLVGYPIVGDFDGDGHVDLGTYADDVFKFDLSSIGGTVIPGLPGLDGKVDVAFTIDLNFIGVRERPVAADMDQDGFVDVGLWVPDRSGATPEEAGEWYFIISGGRPIFERIIPDPIRGNPVIPFNPVPFGNDLFAQFGDRFALPVVGNFDPPTTAASTVPATLKLQGTPGDDVFRFVGAPNSRSWIVEINGVAHLLPSGVAALEFDGLGGKDTVVLVGSGGDDDAVLGPGGGVLTGEGYQVTVANVESIEVRGGGGTDTAKLYGRKGAKDSLEATPQHAELSGDGYLNRVESFREVHAYGHRGDGDLAILRDDPTDLDVLLAKPAFAVLSGPSYSRYFNRAVSFDEVRAYGTPGSGDVARLYDDPAAPDLFEATPERGLLAGNGFANQAFAFDRVYAYATAGSGDQARLDDDPAAPDKFFGKPGDSAFVGSAFYNRALGFDSVVARATKESGDVAKLYDDPTGADVLVATPQGATLSGRGFANEAVAFDRVFGYATPGGGDSAEMFGDPKTYDVFVGKPAYAYQYGAQFDNRAVGFDRVTGHATDASDLARLFDSAGNDLYVGTPEYGQLSGDRFSNRAVGFGTVIAYGTAGGVDAAELYGSSANDYFKADATLNYARLSGSGFLHRLDDFERVGVFGGGGADLAALYDAVLEKGLVDPPAGIESVIWLYDFAQINQVDRDDPDSFRKTNAAIDEAFTVMW